MLKIKFQPVKGTRDFYPDDMAFRNWLFKKMKKVGQKFGYQQYDGPILEPLALYESKSGEELVSNQTYSLTDRGGDIIALRPEMTPTLARMVAQKQNEFLQTVRWFTIGPRFRYEQPQKGRCREFYQWDVDLLGNESTEADAEILGIAAEFLKALDLTSTEVKIKLNDRKLMEKLFQELAIPTESYTDLLRIIDRKDKMDESDWKEWLSEIGLNKEQANKLEKILQDKSTQPKELDKLFSLLKIMGIADYFEYDQTIVRGLDYYTGLVFEARDTKGEFRAILGGGRYDNLVEVVGGTPLAGIGFAAGDAVIEAVLDKYNKKGEENKRPALMVAPIDEKAKEESLELATKMRNLDIKTLLFLDPTVKLEKQLKYADDEGIKFVAIIGTDELKKGVITLRNMETRKQEEIIAEDLEKAIQ